jgi:putative multiple sugar transport system permease protein
LVIPCALLLGALIGAGQGYFVAYSKIPSFIVTLAGMLIFRGLTGNMLLGQFVGPFPKAFRQSALASYPISATLAFCKQETARISSIDFRW